jgi:hypothetical protein
MKRLILLCIVMLACSFSAEAHTEYLKGETFLGYSYVHFSLPFAGFNANGGSGQLTYNFNGYIGLAGDFGGYHVGTGTTHGSGTVFTYLFGPKFTAREGNWSPFAQALFGGAWLGAGVACVVNPTGVTPQVFTCGTSSSFNSFAMAFGGGVDYRAAEHVSIRLVDVD